MSDQIKKAVRTTNRQFLKLWASILAMIFWLIGMAGCCRQQAVEYGIIPMYGPIVPDYGIPYIEDTLDANDGSVSELRG